MSLTILNKQIAAQIESRTDFVIHYKEQNQAGKPYKDYFSVYDQGGKPILVSAGIKKEIKESSFKYLLDINEKQKFCTDALIINADEEMNAFAEKILNIE